VPNAAVSVVSAEKARVLKETEYCVVLNPVDRANGCIQEGRRKVISGPDVFFLEPGEALEGDVRRKHVLSEMQGLKLQALDDFSEPEEGGEPRPRKAGDTWIVRGPRTYVPNEKVVIHKEISALSLGQGEGLYVRDLRSGKVSLVQGPCQFMPEAHQELHEKRLSPDAEAGAGCGAPLPCRTAAQKPTTVMQSSRHCFMVSEQVRPLTHWEHSCAWAEKSLSFLTFSSHVSVHFATSRPEDTHSCFFSHETRHSLLQPTRDIARPRAATASTIRFFIDSSDGGASCPEMGSVQKEAGGCLRGLWPCAPARTPPGRPSPPDPGAAVPGPG